MDSLPKGHKYYNAVILCKDIEHGEKIVAWGEELLKERLTYTGHNIGDYYGFVKGHFRMIRNHHNSILKTTNIIPDIPNDYPKVMRVWNNLSDIRIKRVVFMEKNGQYLAWARAETLEEAEDITNTAAWSHAVDIEEEEIKEFTFQEISEGKATGVPPHLIRIKE